MTGDDDKLWRSPNFNSRDGTPVDMLVIHYTGMQTCLEALDRLCDPEAEVSAHYLIEEDGKVHPLVDETERAWHGGVSSWRGKTNINSRSIGIELVNPGHEWGYRTFPVPQMKTLIRLAKQIVARHEIPARNVVGHSDVAPARKLDPGEFFDWPTLARNGLGIWPDENNLPDACETYDVMRYLADIGYDIDNEPAAIAAFQRHFRRRRFDGKADEETRRTIAAVRALI